MTFKLPLHAMLALAVLGAGRASASDDHDHPAAASPSTAPAHDEHGHDAKAHGADGHAEDAHADEVKLTAEAIRHNHITVATVAKRTLAPTFVAPGRVAFDAESMAHVGVAVKGRVVEVKVRTGDAVAKGDELLVVESPELGEAQSEYVQRRTAASVAEIAIAPARQAYERAKTLHEKSEGIALAEVQRREAELRTAEGALATTRASLTAAENALRLLGMDAGAIKKLAQTGEINPRFTVKALLSGEVVEREVTVGELVSPEKDSLLVTADLSKVWVLADVPETRLAEVGVGSAARLRVAASGEAVDGTVSYVSPALDPTTRTGRVRVVVANERRLLRPGMFARVELAAASGTGTDAVLAVPDEAVQNYEGGTVVFVPVEGEENTFAARPVRVGSPVGGFVPVLNGLNEGDHFVATGSFVLKADLGKAGAAHEH
ncbi:MAG: efflux RND transporter periplasmic adaptor subunit [Tepidisphaeraceae bacterium]